MRQEAASLRQRLEEAEREIENIRAEWSHDCKMAHLNGYDDAKCKYEARASQAEAVLEEMQKQWAEFAEWLKFQERAAVDSMSSDDYAKALAELQSRRSPTGQEKA